MLSERPGLPQTCPRFVPPPVLSAADAAAAGIIDKGHFLRDRGVAGIAGLLPFRPAVQPVPLEKLRQHHAHGNTRPPGERWLRQSKAQGRRQVKKPQRGQVRER